MSKILVAEDDAFLVKMYRLHLEGAGYNVTIASDGQEAIAQLQKELPDLLLLDLLMPNVNGFAVMEYIQKKQLNTPVLVLSNLSQEIDQKQCQAMGAKDYFVKSDMSLQDLSSKISKYL